MQISVFGLGKMGNQIARRLQKKGFDVLAWNRSPEPREEVAKAGVKTFGEVEELIKQTTGEQRIFWLMLPQAIVHDFVFGEQGLMRYLKEGDIIIDGGNSFYKESIKLAALLNAHGIVFFDCGTSGGVWGYDNGFALMVGGPKEHWPAVEPVFKALSAGNNYGLVGENGAGHFVKMVHNGIEYGMMESIAEGYAIMHASHFKPDLKTVTKIYQEGSVVRSWLIDLMANIYENEDLEKTSGQIGMLGEGEWTVRAGHELGIDVRVLEDSVKVRIESSDPKNQNKYSNKIVALLRKQFGGHGVKNKK